MASAVAVVQGDGTAQVKLQLKERQQASLAPGERLFFVLCFCLLRDVCPSLPPLRSTGLSLCLCVSLPLCLHPSLSCSFSLSVPWSLCFSVSLCVSLCLLLSLLLSRCVVSFCRFQPFCLSLFVSLCLSWGLRSVSSLFVLWLCLLLFRV